MTAFDVVYADPPWRYDNGTPGREIERHYPTMSHEDICGVRPPVARDAVLYLWAGAVSVVLIVGGCWLVWRAWFA